LKIGLNNIDGQKCTTAANRVGCPTGTSPAGRASHTTVRTGLVYGGSLQDGEILRKYSDRDS